MSEADGSLYFSTGNTDGVREWQDGEGVFCVAPNLAHPIDPRDSFAPSNGKQPDDDELDLGGVTPLPHTLPGSPIPPMLAPGKDGKAYLLNRTFLGGLGGALAVRPAARGAIITAATTYPVRDAVLVAYQARSASCPNGAYMSGIAALAVRAEAGNRPDSAWCARLDGRGAPIVTTTDDRSEPIVWAVAAEGDDWLHGFRGDTGEEIHAGAGTRDGMNGLRHFATILVAAGRFYIAGDRASSHSNCHSETERAVGQGCLR